MNIINLYFLLNLAFAQDPICDANTVESKIEHIKENLGIINCFSLYPPDACGTKLLGSGLALTSGIAVESAAQRSIKIENYKSNKINKRISRIYRDVDDLKSAVSDMDTLIAKAIKDEKKLRLTAAEIFTESYKDSQMLRTDQKKYLNETIEEKLSKINALEVKTASSNAKLIQLQRLSRVGKVLSLSSVPLMAMDVTTSDPCSGYFSDAITHFDKNCKPVPTIGEKEFSFFFSKTKEERAKIIKENPIICSQIHQIDNSYTARIQILDMLYNSGNKVENLNCTHNEISYQLKGNEIFGTMNIKARFNSDKKLKKMEIAGIEQTPGPIIVDYASDGDDEVINQVRWESSDPKDSWRGSRSVLRGQLDEARENPVVERAGLASQFFKNSILGQRATECCQQGTGCDQFFKKSQKSGSKVKASN